MLCLQIRDIVLRHVINEPLSFNDFASMPPAEEVEVLSLTNDTIQPSLVGSTEVATSLNETALLSITAPNITSCANSSMIHEINGLLLEDDVVLPASAAPRDVDAPGPGSADDGDDIALSGSNASERGIARDGSNSGAGDDVWLGMNAGTIAGVFAAAGVGLLLIGAALLYFVLGRSRRRNAQRAEAPAAAAVAEASSVTAAGAGRLRTLDVWEEEGEGELETVRHVPLPSLQWTDPQSPSAAQPWLPVISEDAQPTSQLHQFSPQSLWQNLFGRSHAAAEPAAPPGRGSA
jgi:hypothetical protein